MKKKILVTKNLLKETEERVQKLFDTKLNKEEKLYTTEDIIELSKDCDGILSFSSDKIDSAAINKLSDKVKIIANYAVGFGNIDTNAAAKKGIVVTNTPEVLSEDSWYGKNWQRSRKTCSRLWYGNSLSQQN